MIVWTGYGILGFIVMLASFVLPLAGSIVFLENNPNYPPYLIGFAVLGGLFLGGATGWYLGRRWNHNAKPDQLHTIYFIRVEYWGVLMFCVASVMTLGVIFGAVKKAFE